MKSGGIIGIMALTLAGAMLADVLAHAQGTRTAFAGLASLWTPSLKAASGQAL